MNKYTFVFDWGEISTTAKSVFEAIKKLSMVLPSIGMYQDYKKETINDE
jgi:hypothetical protein